MYTSPHCNLKTARIGLVCGVALFLIDTTFTAMYSCTGFSGLMMYYKTWGIVN